MIYPQLMKPIKKDEPPYSTSPLDKIYCHSLPSTSCVCILLAFPKYFTEYKNPTIHMVTTGLNPLKQ